MKNKYSVIILNALPDKKIKSLGNKGLITLDNAYYLRLVPMFVVLSIM